MSLRVFAFASLFSLALGGVSLAEQPSRIVIQNFDFTPMTLTVNAGAMVTWTNKDGEPHTVVSEDGLFHSKALDEGDSFSFKFDKPGTYKILCSIHPQMRGIITVR